MSKFKKERGGGPNDEASGRERGVSASQLLTPPLQQICPCCEGIANRIPDPRIAQPTYSFQISQSLQMTFNLNLKLYIKGPNKTIFRTKSTNQDQAQMGGGLGVLQTR